MPPGSSPVTGAGATGDTAGIQPGMRQTGGQLGHPRPPSSSTRRPLSGVALDTEQAHQEEHHGREHSRGEG